MIRSAVFSPKKTNPCFLEALGSLMFLLVRGCQRLGQPIEKPISPRPSGTGIFPYSRMPALKRLLADRYEFLLYKHLRHGLEAGDIFCRDSVRFRSMEDDLLDDTGGAERTA